MSAEAPVASPAIVQKAPDAPPLAPNDLKYGDQIQQRRFAEVNNEVTVADLLRPAFWAHCTNLEPLAEITVMPKDGSWHCKLLVRDVGRLYAICALIGPVVRLGADIEAPPDAEYDIRWCSPGAKYGVYRLADKSWLQTGFAGKHEANVWLVEHLKAFKR